MGEWDVVSPPTRADDWEIASPPTRITVPRRGGAAGGPSTPGSSVNNPVGVGVAVPINGFGRGPDGSISQRTANGWRVVQPPPARPRPPAPPAPPPRRNPIDELIPGFGTGALKSAMGQGVDVALNTIGLGGGPGAESANNIVPQAMRLFGFGADDAKRATAALEANRRYSGRITGSDVVGALDRAAGPNGLFYRPTTQTGRVAETVGSFAPAALFPGSMMQRAAYVGAPLAGNMIASGVTEMAGGDADAQAAAGSVGAIAGGFGAALAPTPRVAPGQGVAPTGIDPAVPIATADAVKAADYVQRQIPETVTPVVRPAPERGMTTGEMGGRRSQTALAALARREGTTADSLQGVVETRRADRPDRIMSDVEAATGSAPGRAASDVEAIIEAGRAKAAPLYDAALASPEPVMSNRLRVISEAPEVQRAMRQAYEDMANNPDGPPAAGVFAEGDGGRMTMLEPTMEAWDRVYKSMQARVERDPITGKVKPDSQSPMNANINRARRALREELGALNPAWDTAVKAAGEYKPVEQAYAWGNGDLFSMKVTAANVASRINGMGPGELQGYRAGIANRIFDMAQNDRLTTAKLLVPAVRAKLEAALGREATAELIDATRSEAAMAAFEQRYAPDRGSITSDMNAAMAEQDATGGNPLMDGAIDFATDAARKRSLVSAAAGLAIKLGDKIAANVKTRGMNTPARDEAGRMLVGTEDPAVVRARALAVLEQAKRAKPRIELEDPYIARFRLGAPQSPGP